MPGGERTRPRGRRLVEIASRLGALLNPATSFAQPAEAPVTSRESLVVAYHPEVRAIGQSILHAGGNAFDAFVAVAAAENVMAEGASSLAGSLGVLLYDAAQHEVAYLDADFSDPLDPTWRWREGMPRDGRAVLVPGAPAGLEVLARHYGTMPLDRLLQPSIELAERGFPVSRLMARMIAWRRKVLRRTEYGCRTFFSPRGRPLAVGETLRQPEVAAFLSSVADEGAAHVYSGPWGTRFLDVVRGSGGVLTERDLSGYGVSVHAPRRVEYRGRTIHACSGRTYGGLWALVALKTLEHQSLPAGTHYTDDAATLETMVRIAHQVWEEPALLDARTLDDPEAAASLLTPQHTGAIWQRVEDGGPFRGIARAGSHSYHIITIDRDGNCASGTTTIESDPWGEGVFVAGLPLSFAGAIPWSTAAGQRRLSPFSMHFVLDGDRLQFSVGAISNSVVEAAFQFLVSLIDYGLPVREVVCRPRFGTFPARPRLSTGKNWLDPRVNRRIVSALRKRGLRFERRGTLDTGLGAVLAVAADGTRTGICAPVPYVPAPFSS